MVIERPLATKAFTFRDSLADSDGVILMAPITEDSVNDFLTNQPVNIATRGVRTRRLAEMVHRYKGFNGTHLVD